MDYCIQIISFRRASASQISLLSNWNIRRQGEVLRDRQFLALFTMEIQIQVQIHCQIRTSVDMKYAIQIQINTDTIQIQIRDGHADAEDADSCRLCAYL